jgi:hypothetical protein
MKALHTQGGNELLALPLELKPLFWEYDFDTLSWDKDRDLVVSKVLNSGSWDNLQWLRGCVGDRYLRDWITAHKGRGMGRRDLRFYQFLFRIPKKLISEWLAAPERKIWDNR